MVVVDLETYPNWFCVVASDGERNATYSSSRGNLPKLAKLLASKNIVIAGFNNFAYDDILLRAVIADPSTTPEHVNRLSSRVIDPQDESDERANFQARYAQTPWAYSIDVFQLLNGRGSLKEHACRANARDVGETPFAFGQPLPPAGIPAVERYCALDVANTAARLADLWPLVSLREKLSDTFNLGDRVYVLSEQGLAQATFLKLHSSRSGEYVRQVREASMAHRDNLTPTWAVAKLISPKVAFHTTPFRDVLAGLAAGTVSRLDGIGAKWVLQTQGLPDSLVVDLVGRRFQLGVGGLHSIDAPGIFHSTPASRVIDLDVTSYYPSIIIGDRVFPAHLGPAFVDDMRRIRDMRIAAKKAGDKSTADALKIVTNATFGKLNDVYSPLRSVPSALRVTVNGQLYLLMLIEALADAGFAILSANTDGVTIRADTSLLPFRLESVIAAWQTTTGLTLERTDYRMYARRDVNSYVAISGNKLKLKGAFQPETGKGDGVIVKRAAVAYLTKGIPIAHTVRNARVEELVFYQRCKNGGTLYHGETAIGRLARWYASVEGPSIRRRNPNQSWATVPHGHRSSLIMNLDDIGCDIDFDHYEKEAAALVESCTL